MHEKNEYVGYTKTGTRQNEKTPGENKKVQPKVYAQIIGTIKTREKTAGPKTCFGAE